MASAYRYRRDDETFQSRLNAGIDHLLDPLAGEVAAVVYFDRLPVLFHDTVDDLPARRICEGSHVLAQLVPRFAVLPKGRGCLVVERQTLLDFIVDEPLQVFLVDILSIEASLPSEKRTHNPD